MKPNRSLMSCRELVQLRGLAMMVQPSGASSAAIVAAMRSERKLLMALIWNEAEQVFDVVPGTCPAPWPGDDGSAKRCVQCGHCGCDEIGKETSDGADLE